MTQAKETVEPNYTCPVAHQNNKSFFSFFFFKKKNCIEDSSYAPSATVYRLLGHNLLKQPMNPDTSFTLRTIFEESVIKFTIISVITICEK